MTEYEEMLISQIMLMPEIMSETSVNPEMITDYSLRAIFSAIIAVIGRGIKPDIISVRDVDGSISPARIVEVSGKASSSANWRYYEEAIVGGWKRRELSRLGMRLAESEEPHEALLKAIEDKLAELSYATGRRKVGKASDYITEYLDTLQGRFNNKGVLPGISSGIEKLDALTQGLKPRLLYVIGGRPSQGKSALGLNIAAHITMREKKPVGFLSLESSTMELMERLMASTAKIDSRRLATGYFSQSDLGLAMDAGQKIWNAPLWFWDQPNAKIADVVSIARFMRRQHKVEVLVLDYLQLIGVPGAVDRRDSVAQASMAMKQLARELEVPIVVLAQLNRDSDNRRPEMGDFQWSSQIEQDADVGIMLYHKMSGTDEERTIDKSWLFVEKCRDGKRGSVPVVFRQEYVRFEDAQ